MESLRTGDYQPFGLYLTRKHGAVWLLTLIASLPWLAFLPGPDLQLAGGILGAFLSLLAVLDFHYGLLYDCLLLPLAFLGLILEAAGILPAGAWPACLAAMMAAGFLWSLRFISRGGLGFGDVKFAAVLGLWLGGQGVLVALSLAILLGGFWALWLLLEGHGSRESLPFGPCLSIGGYGAYLFGDSLWQLYWEWLL